MHIIMRVILTSTIIITRTITVRTIFTNCIVSITMYINVIIFPIVHITMRIKVFINITTIVIIKTRGLLMTAQMIMIHMIMIMIIILLIIKLSLLMARHRPSPSGLLLWFLLSLRIECGAPPLLWSGSRCRLRLTVIFRSESTFFLLLWQKWTRFHFV